MNDSFGLLIWLPVMIGGGVWCYKIAKRNGFNAVVAAMIGFLMPVAAVIGYLYFSPKNQREIAERESRHWYGKYSSKVREGARIANNFGRRDGAGNDKGSQ